MLSSSAPQKSAASERKQEDKRRLRMHRSITECNGVHSIRNLQAVRIPKQANGAVCGGDTPFERGHVPSDRGSMLSLARVRRSAALEVAAQRGGSTQGRRTPSRTL
jgi:hypothetical protein